ncbi:MAG: hypothetical protein WCK26_03760, partial [Candidatus Saccharibacteria bacterium]
MKNSIISFRNKTNIKTTRKIIGRVYQLLALLGLLFVVFVSLGFINMQVAGILIFMYLTCWILLLAFEKWLSGWPTQKIIKMALGIIFFIIFFALILYIARRYIPDLIINPV